MAIPVIMPRQGQSVESCILTGWHKQVGDAVNEGDLLFSYETDKAAFEEAAKASGTLLTRFFDVDDDVPCLLNIAVIGAPGESYAEYDPRGDTAPAAKETSAEEAAQAPAPAVARPMSLPASAPENASVSPRARMVAERLGVDTHSALPTGPHGRVIERDILLAAQHGLIAPAIAPAAAPTAPQAVPVAVADTGEYEVVKQTNTRKAIANGMLSSLQTTAQLTNHGSCDASAILALRKQFKEAPENIGLPNITLNDMVLYAVSRVLKRHKDLNAHFVEGVLRRYHHVHLGIAVDTPRGLLVPTIFNADTLSLGEIAMKSKELALAAQSGSINPDLLFGATFTISNLGPFGVERFTPIINPPQTGILGVCNIMERVRTVGGVLTAYPAMGLSLTYDHRVVDGAPAARFLQDLSVTIAHFTAILA